MSYTWHPDTWIGYCPEDLRGHCVRTLEMLRGLILSRPSETISLAGGATAEVLFLQYLQRLRPDEKTALGIAERLQRIQAGLHELPPLTLFSGQLGILLAFEMLPEISDAIGTSRLRDRLEDEACSYLDNLPSTVKWDVVDGLAGIGLLALSAPSAPNDRLSTLCALSLGEVTRNTIRHSPHVDLGFAHGLAGAVTVLARMQPGGATASDVFRYAVEILQSTRLAGFPSLYPYRRGELAASRLAWCYGDLTIAHGLFRLSPYSSTSNKLAEDALSASLSRPTGSALVEEGGLCHGALGVAHITMRMARFSSNERIEFSAVEWLRFFLAMSDAGKPGVFNGTGFLEGAAGGGLALLASLGVEPDWDLFLLP